MIFFSFLKNTDGEESSFKLEIKSSKELGRKFKIKHKNMEEERKKSQQTIKLKYMRVVNIHEVRGSCQPSYVPNGSLKQQRVQKQVQTSGNLKQQVTNAHSNTLEGNSIFNNW